jgi:aspartyl-tRNA(Asn)/glutamyl-tRNA(Gln) amidotransferase subunit C
MSKTTIDRARIEHVAKLASLTLTDAEADTLAAEITMILGHVDELGDIDTSEVEVSGFEVSGFEVGGFDVAGFEALARSAWREDVVEPSLSNADAVAQAQRTSGEPGQAGFVVPVFVES